jgi:hypothetical protein
VIASGGGDRTVRVWRLAAGSPLAHPLDLFEPTYGIAFMATIIVTAVGGTSLSTSPSPHYPYEIASCSAASAYRHDHRIMAGYPVHRRASAPCSGGKQPAECATRTRYPVHRCRGRAMTGNYAAARAGPPARSRPRPQSSSPRRRKRTRISATGDTAVLCRLLARANPRYVTEDPTITRRVRAA